MSQSASNLSPVIYLFHSDGKVLMISWGLKTRGLQPIGLDVGSDSVKMIQLAINGGHIRVVAAAKVRIDRAANDDPQMRRQFVVSSIRQMLSQAQFRGPDVVCCLPNDSLKITSLRLSETDADAVRRSLQREAMQRFGFDPEKDSIDYLLAGTVQQGEETKSEYILFATDDLTIRNHIQMLEQAGLRPVGIDAVPCALFRSFSRSLRRQEDKGRTAVFVDVGSRFTTVVFGRQGEINFIKRIPIAGDNFTRQVASKLGISFAEAELLRNKLRSENRAGSGGRAATSDGAGQCDAGRNRLDASTRQAMVDAISSVAEELAREISLCSRYYTVTFRGKRVERAVFSGGEAYEQVLLNVLRRQLAVEVEVAQPLRGFDLMSVTFEGDRRGLLCEWAVAVGLALKGWKGNVEVACYERD